MYAIRSYYGLLVGLQREYAHLQKEAVQEEDPTFGGTRTFALLALLGCTAAYLSDKAGSVLVFVTIVGIVGGLIMIAYIATARKGSLGMTSEAAAIATMLTGAICYWHELAVAAALGVASYNFV